MKINLLYRDEKTIDGTRRLMRFPLLRNEVNGTRISGKKCAMHWWQGATAARRLKHTYRKRNAFLPDCKGPKQA
ncbi:hypothetical protein [Paenibacillus polymyxa]|uniref:Uncharacterized protein n=1 Tax=Paenibacillus polymyxa TaxID=1406 RepID=A0AAE9IE70_PAEPO|nr:hypothetical protein [Paenibacillus polymyxa]URJ50991.1 hypothetical protein MF626_000379 [Paenibacillus polymyxa]